MRRHRIAIAIVTTILTASAAFCAYWWVYRQRCAVALLLIFLALAAMS